MNIITKILANKSVLILLIILPQLSYCIPGWQWANTAGGTSEERAYNTATDAAGNVYATGSYNTSSIIFGTNTLTNSGVEDIFLVKYDPAGNVIWATSFSGTNTEMAYTVVCDNAGNIYMTGYFESPTLIMGTFTLTNAGMKDIFIAKLDSSGTVLWANSYGGNGDDYGNNLSVDAGGNVFFIGNYTSPSITFGTTTLVNPGNAKVCVVKLNTNGNALWVDGSNGGSFDTGKYITTDIAGNIYIAGQFYDLSIWFNTDTIINTGDQDIFIVKYDSSGNELWIRSIGGFNTEDVTGLAGDDNGDLYFSGHFYSPFIEFDTILLNNAGFPAWDMFIAKLDENSNVIWAKSAAGNTDEDVIVDLEKGPNGNLFITGWFGNSITLGNTVLASNGSIDVFASELDTAGNFQWAIAEGGADQDFTYSISVDAMGEIFLGGFFKSDSLPFGNTLLIDNNPGWDMFVAKLGNTTGIKETHNDKLSLYPNPSSGKFFLSQEPNSLLQASIFNVTGECLQEINLENISEIDLSNYPKGIYFLQVIENTGIIKSSKLVVE